MFITPNFVREAIADQTGGKADGIAVRIWAAAGFYFALGLLVGFLIWGGAALFGSAKAAAWHSGLHAPTFEANFERAREVANEKARLRLVHGGRVSNSDWCHKDRKTGERHWHRGKNSRGVAMKHGNRNVGGPCVGGIRLTGNGICAKARVAFAIDKAQGWTVDWQRHANALKDCIVRLPARR